MSAMASQITINLTVCSTTSGWQQNSMTGPLWGDSTGERWIRLSEGQQSGKCSHSITSGGVKCHQWWTGVSEGAHLTPIFNAFVPHWPLEYNHYSDVIMGGMASQINSLAIVYSSVYSGVDRGKHQSSVSLAFVRGIHQWPWKSPHKGPVTRKMISFDHAIMTLKYSLFYMISL